MPCTLLVSGYNFDVDEYLSKVDWGGIELEVFYKGQKKGHTGKFGVFDHSGFSINVSNAEFENFKNQEKDVVAFIKRYKSNFSLLKEYPIDAFHEFDFGLATYPSNQFSKTYILSSELLQLVGETGMNIWMTNYFTRNDDHLRRQARKHQKVWRIKKPD